MRERIDCDELATMNENNLRMLLQELEFSEDTSLWSRQELLDYIIDEYADHCFHQLHSEGRDYNYSDMHPDETLEEFEEHEDYEPRDDI
jgi:hypothetical protein